VGVAVPAGHTAQVFIDGKVWGDGTPSAGYAQSFTIRR
jgi:nitrate/nitrite transport system substrate-binding protein